MSGKTATTITFETLRKAFEKMTMIYSGVDLAERKVMRDNQKSKVRRSLSLLNAVPENKGFPGEQETFNYIVGVTRQPWFTDIFGRVFVECKRGSKDAQGTRRQLFFEECASLNFGLPPWTWRPANALYLLARAIQPENTEFHGKEFCAIYAFLVKKCMSAEAISVLIHAFVKHKVDYKPISHIYTIEGQMAYDKLMGNKLRLRYKSKERPWIIEASYGNQTNK